MYSRIAALAVAASVCVPAVALEGTNEFNPAISVIFDGLYYHDSASGDGAELLEEHDSVLHAHGGHDHDDHGSLNQGFNLGETELVLSGTADPYFDAWLTATLSTDGAAIEEAWLRSRSLPAGLQVKGGRFLSAIGYHNEKHPHSWDFADQNLAYQSLLGDHGLAGNGLQLTWLAPTRAYLQLGLELLQGDELERFGMGVDADGIVEALADEFATVVTEEDLNLARVDGPALSVAFARFAPDLGANQALQLGLSWGHHRRQSGFHEEGAEAFVSEGDADLFGAQLTWKRFATAAHGHGALQVQAEYLAFESSQTVVYHMDPLELGAPIELAQDAAYLQGSWGMLPRWQLAVRTSLAGINGEISENGARESIDLSRQHSASLTWLATEFSRLRLQVNRNDLSVDGGREAFNQIMLQYNLSLGAHGAHSF